MDKSQQIAYAIVVVVAIIASIFYGIWYWNNCAFVPYFKAPTLCHAGTTSQSR